MPDEYHFMRDDGSLIDARLTKDEAECVGNYRRAQETLDTQGRDDVTYIVVIVPVSREMATDDLLKAAERAAWDATVDVIFHASTSAR